MHSFFDLSTTSLKVCGITRAADATGLVEAGIPALGVNFWPQSKRYIAPQLAKPFLHQVAGKILRVGVFVNAPAEEVTHLLEQNIIDVAQFHGDESIEYCQNFRQSKQPFIKAIGVDSPASLSQLSDYGANAVLLDAHAPGVYGGTGKSFDWNLAAEVVKNHPSLPILLAGGITASNAQQASSLVHPAALDLASGSESSPGIKDFGKIRAIQAAVKASL